MKDMDVALGLIDTIRAKLKLFYDAYFDKKRKKDIPNAFKMRADAIEETIYWLVDRIYRYDEKGLFHSDLEELQKCNLDLDRIIGGIE